MVEGSDGAVLRQVGRLLRGEGVAGLSDGQLLERFATRADDGAEVAFEAILRRHGPMVLGVCRRVLRDPHAAEDAFQATFLVLARKARSVRVESSLGHWLYGVTYRIAVRARVQADRRRAREGGDPAVLEAPMEDDADRRDLDAAIHEEVARLPEKYRRPIVLCYFEGRSHEAAAEALQWPVGTVRGRLARARDLLRRRLSRRGLAPSAGAIGAILVPRGASASVPGPLLENTVAAAARVAAGRSVAAGMVSATAAALSEGALRTMTLAKLKWALAGVVALGIAGGAGARAYQGQGRGHGPGPIPIQLAQAKAEERKDGPAPAPAEPKAVEEKKAAEPRPAEPSEPLPPPDALPAADPPALPEPKPAEATPSLPPMPEQTKVAAEPPPLAGSEVVSTPDPEPAPPDLGQTNQNLVNVKNGLVKRIQVLEGRTKDLRSQAEAADVELKSARSMLAALERAIQPTRAQEERLREHGFLPTLLDVTNPPPSPETRRAVPPPEAPPSPRFAKPGDQLDIDIPSTNPKGMKSYRVKVDRLSMIDLDNDRFHVGGMSAVDIKEHIVNFLHFKRGMSDVDLGLFLTRDGGIHRVHPRDTDRVRVLFVHVPEKTPDDRIKALEEKLDRVLNELKTLKPAGAAERGEVSPREDAGKMPYFVLEGDVDGPGRYRLKGQSVVDALQEELGWSPSPSDWKIRLIRPDNPNDPNAKPTSAELPVNLAAIARGDTTTNYALLPGDRLVVEHIKSSHQTPSRTHGGLGP
ncbi:MAG TPA: sigma-70 family RNA polymerase sigma factor [Isosphaeraceae bacterium]|jgi:RNA polymerase sigma factor (sigma-70 family)|nr:sigma-70 family RNA polymerase sigma factor [Isosphaeraceae bacterium]